MEDPGSIDDAFRGLSRPWFKLKKEPRKAVTVTVDPGIGVQLKLEDLP